MLLMLSLLIRQKATGYQKIYCIVSLLSKQKAMFLKARYNCDVCSDIDPFKHLFSHKKIQLLLYVLNSNICVSPKEILDTS